MDTKYQLLNMPVAPPMYQPIPDNPQMVCPPQHPVLNVPVPAGPSQIIYSPQVMYPLQYPHQHQALNVPVPNGQSQVTYYPQYVQGPPQQTDNVTTLKHTTLHYRLGISFVCIGIVACLLDLLKLRLILYYPHVLFPAGIFMIISGSTSISASKQNRKCHLVVSMVFDILAAIDLCLGLIAAIVVVSTSNYYYRGYERYHRFDSRKGFAIFQIIYCTILFCVVIWDSSLKCSDACCCNKRPRQQPPNTVYVYAVQSPPQVVT